MTIFALIMVAVWLVTIWYDSKQIVKLEKQLQDAKAANHGLLAELAQVRENTVHIDEARQLLGNRAAATLKGEKWPITARREGWQVIRKRIEDLAAADSQDARNERAMEAHKDIHMETK